MWKTKNYQLKGVSPVIMSNGMLANPGYIYTKELKKYLSKTKKTEEDAEMISQIEYYGGLYMDIDTTTPCIPALVIEATFTNGAKKTKCGMLAKMGMFIEKNMILKYDGPTSREELYKDERFVDRRMVVVNKKSRVLRTRPIFQEWGGMVEVSYDTDVVDVSKLDDWVRAAGSYVGFCEMRPKYGRFIVVEE